MTHDVTTSEGLARIGALRERFLEGADTDLSGIRPRIAHSWRRCAAMRVDPTAPIQIDESARVDERTLQCAAPFVQDLERMAIEAGGDVTVISPRGALVKDITPALGDRYPHGLVLLEDVCGTNGDGTALEDGQSGWVHSREHYHSAMQGSSCFSALVRDPFRDNVRACLTLTLPEAVMLDSDPGAIGLIVQGVAAKITRELVARSATREQMLLEEYLRAARRYKNAAIVATDGKNTMLSDPALELLREDDFAAISSYAQDALRSRRQVKHRVTLSGDRLVQLHISIAGEEGDPVGAIVLAKLLAADPAADPVAGAPSGTAASQRAFDGLVGGSQGFHQALETASTAIATRRPVHVIGDRGVGKRTIALRVAGAWSPDVEILNCGRSEIDDPPLLESAQLHLRTGGALVLRDADRLPPSSCEALARLFGQLERPLVVLTLERPTAAATTLASALDSTEISVPPLRARREDIPALAVRFIADLTEKRPSARLLYVLAQADWPGNVAELRSAVEQAAMVARGPEITIDDLPQSFCGGTRHASLSRLEEVELQELRAVLGEAKGNRSLAADILQIGRSTLYRRLDSYRRRGIVI